MENKPYKVGDFFVLSEGAKFLGDVIHLYSVVGHHEYIDDFGRNILEYDLYSHNEGVTDAWNEGYLGNYLRKISDEEALLFQLES